MNGVIYLLDQAGAAIQQLTAEVERLKAEAAEKDAEIAKLKQAQTSESR